MNRGDKTYIWQASDWPAWRYDLTVLAQPMADASRAQGLLMGRLADVGMALRDQASLSALTDDVIKTSEIEGEQLNVESVRSSIARRLGVADVGQRLGQHSQVIAPGRPAVSLPDVGVITAFHAEIMVAFSAIGRHSTHVMRRLGHLFVAPPPNKSRPLGPALRCG
jgi:Fic family protein